MLRAQKLLERRQQNQEQKSLSDHKIVQKISKLEIFKKAQRIVIYLPIHGEVDLTALIETHSKHKTFILPRTVGKKLHLHIIQDLTQTANGKFNILEPHPHLPIIKPDKVDLFLIPGVVFSEDGHRIGYGKGFYDRLLKKSHCHKIGIAYDFQIVKNIPGESHDVLMDMIITEQRTLKVERQSLPAAKKFGQK